MAKPKLALIPATQGSKLYSVLPADGVGDFTFSRGSSATRINAQGLIETVASGVSRLNYPLIDGKVVGCPSHILEPQRLQKIQYSEAFDNAYWTKSGASVVSGFVSPSGDTSAFKLVEDSISSSKSIKTSNFSVVNGQEYTISIFAKPNGRFLQITPSVAFVQSYINYDLNNGTMDLSGSGSASGTITLLSSGYYRCTYTAAANASSTIASIFSCLVNSISATRKPSYQGDGTSGIYIFGAQTEQGSYPTSYIPNYGTSAGITRSAETANGAGDASTFNDSEGVLMMEISTLQSSGEDIYISVNNGVSNRITLRNTSSLNNVVGQCVVGGVNQASMDYTLEDRTANNKVSIRYKLNDFSLWVNGFKVVTDNIGSVPTSLNDLSYTNGSGVANWYGNTKQIQYFDSALNDSDLETLTSWVSFSDMANGQLYTIE
jgi:hypothetical protein